MRLYNVPPPVSKYTKAPTSYLPPYNEQRPSNFTPSRRVISASQTLKKNQASLQFPEQVYHKSTPEKTSPNHSNSTAELTSEGESPPSIVIPSYNYHKNKKNNWDQEQRSSKFTLSRPVDSAEQRLKQNQGSLESREHAYDKKKASPDHSNFTAELTTEGESPPPIDKPSYDKQKDWSHVLDDLDLMMMKAGIADKAYDPSPHDSDSSSLTTLSTKGSFHAATNVLVGLDMHEDDERAGKDGLSGLSPFSQQLSWPSKQDRGPRSPASLHPWPVERSVEANLVAPPSTAYVVETKPSERPPLDSMDSWAAGERSKFPSQQLTRSPERITHNLDPDKTPVVAETPVSFDSALSVTNHLTESLEKVKAACSLSSEGSESSARKVLFEDEESIPSFFSSRSEIKAPEIERHPAFFVSQSATKAPAIEARPNFLTSQSATKARAKKQNHSFDSSFPAERVSMEPRLFRTPLEFKTNDDASGKPRKKRASTSLSSARRTYSWEEAMHRMPTKSDADTKVKEQSTKQRGPSRSSSSRDGSILSWESHNVKGEHSLWKMIERDPDVMHLRVDDKEVNQLFCLDKKIAPTGATRNEPVSNRETKGYVIATERATSGSKVLSSIKLSIKNIARAVERVDADPMTPVQVRALISFLPTCDEQVLLRNHLTKASSSIHDLSECEKFMLAILTVKHAKRKLSSILFIQSFSSCLGAIQRDLRLVQRACDEITSSSRLRKILGIVLELGNRLNSQEEAARAVTLGSLSRLTRTKADDDHPTFLHFVVTTVRRNNAALIHFKDDLQTVYQAETIKWASIITQIERLETGLGEVRKVALHMSQAGAPPATQLSESKEVELLRKSSIGVFTLGACVRMSTLIKEVEQGQEQIEYMADYFGEHDLAQGGPDEVFRSICTFGRDFEKALEQVIARDKEKMREIRGITTPADKSANGVGYDDSKKCQLMFASGSNKKTKSKFRWRSRKSPF